MTKDSAPEKWEYEEHTRVKHELLKKYLYAWIKILGKFHRKILFFDGFAGRGEYKDESGAVMGLGSPLIALETANELLKYCEQKGRQPYFDKFVCIGIEKNKINFKNLKSVIEREKKRFTFKDKLEVLLIPDEFAPVINDLLEKVAAKIAPSFFFIDPFGFSGVPFKTVQNILSLPRTEVFFTFMSRDINRFLCVPEVEDILDQLYPSSEWRTIYKIQDWQKRDEALKNLYVKSLLAEAGVKYAWSFRVCMDEKYQTLYYLIHATNHFDGLKIMKDIMYKEGASGLFAYLGPEESKYKGQINLFEIDLAPLEKYLVAHFKGETKSFKEILETVYIYTRFVETHCRSVLRRLEEANKIKIEGKGPKGGINESTKIIFSQNNPTQTNLSPSISTIVNRIKIHYKQYQQLDGIKKNLFHQVNDGSIITRFDKTPLPQKPEDVICPHFVELKWAYGCPYDCAWCYLKGTFRFHSTKTRPVVKSYEKIELHTRKFLEEVNVPEILNTGEIADSLMHENDELPFSKFIIPIFEEQKVHKVLFLTKSSNVENLLEIEPHNQVIMSFSLNAVPVARKWEKAASILSRIEAAKKVYNAGYEVRVRIDPMVPVKNWEKHYLHLLDMIFKNFMPERITLGSLRGLQSTINGCSDRSWVKYLKESSNWGKKVDFKTRLEMYSEIIQELRNKYNFNKVALCKETVQTWKALKMDYKKIRCNCVW